MLTVKIINYYNGTTLKYALIGYDLVSITFCFVFVGTLPNISDPKVIDVVPGKEMYTTILKWNITDGSSTPKIWVTPHVRKDSIIVDDTSFSSLIVNISTYYNKNYTLYVSSTNCNGKKGRSFVLFKGKPFYSIGLFSMLFYAPE